MARRPCVESRCQCIIPCALKDQPRHLAIPVGRQLAVRAAVSPKARPIARRGRPTKLTPGVQRQICREVEAGNFIEIAAELSGVGRSSVFHWIALADGGDPQYLDFRDAIKEARAKAEARAVAAIQKAGRQTWQANAWFLERSFPQRWRRTDAREDPELEQARRDAEAATERADAAEELSAALRRDPNQIPRTLAALEVLDQVIRGEGSPVGLIGDDPSLPRLQSDRT